jgi:pSer/pThr/pTyr-binding forkhead associated (FHA) protein
VKQYIRLKGISEDVKGKVWENDSVLRAGRLGSLEIVLDDTSVSRRHAEVRYQTPSRSSQRT